MNSMIEILSNIVENYTTIINQKARALKCPNVIHDLSPGL